MAFKVAQTPTYKTKITVVIPNEQGTNTTSDFNVVFKRFKVEELEGEGGLKSLLQPELMRKAISSWDGIESDDGEKFEFNAENLEVLIAVPHALKALSEAFWLTQYSAKQKN